MSSSLSRPIKLAGGAALVVLLACGAAGGAWYRSVQKNEKVARALTGGDPGRGEALIRRYGCGGCHTISAAIGADGKVAPPLDQLRKRVYIGGVTQNSPNNLIHWIVSPRSLSPRTAMPATGVSEAEARDIAAFLYAH